MEFLTSFHKEIDIVIIVLFLWRWSYFTPPAAFASQVVCGKACQSLNRRLTAFDRKLSNFPLGILEKIEYNWELLFPKSVLEYKLLLVLLQKISLTFLSSSLSDNLPFLTKSPYASRSLSHRMLEMPQDSGVQSLFLHHFMGSFWEIRVPGPTAHAPLPTSG